MSALPPKAHIVRRGAGEVPEVDMDRIANPSDQVQSRRRGPDSMNRIETDLATEQTVAQKVGPRSPLTPKFRV